MYLLVSFHIFDSLVGKVLVKLIKTRKARLEKKDSREDLENNWRQSYRASKLG